MYAPVTPLEIAPGQRIPRGTIRRLALAWLVALVAVVIGERLLLRLAPAANRGLRRLCVAATSHPCHAILVVSLIATGVATYPVLFLGRSLVSPNNGGLRLLNDWLPGVPASADFVIEDTRASDVSAALYAFVPYTKVQRDALATREWPLWNRYNATGRPLWGQGQTFFLDPLHWLTLITPDPALGWDLKFVAHRFVFAAGIGLAAFVVTNAWVPGAIAAVAAPFVGVYAYRVNHPAVFSLTYAAWALLGWFLLARARDGVGRTRAATLLGAATLLILVASPPKEAVAALLATCGAGILTVLLSGGWRDSLWKLRAALAAGVTVVLVSAPHWLMFLDTLRLSRTAYDKPYAEIAGLPHAVAFFLGPLTGSPVFPGLHALGLVMVLAVLTAPRWVLATREVLACALVTSALVAVAFGLVPDRWLFRIPFIANIGHLHDVFITAAVPLVLILTAAGAVVLLSAGVRRTAFVTCTYPHRRVVAREASRRVGPAKRFRAMGRPFCRNPRCYAARVPEPTQAAGGFAGSGGGNHGAGPGPAGWAARAVGHRAARRVTRPAQAPCAPRRKLAGGRLHPSHDHRPYSNSWPGVGACIR